MVSCHRPSTVPVVVVIQQSREERAMKAPDIGAPCAHVLFAPLPDGRIPDEESAASEFARRASEMLGRATMPGRTTASSVGISRLPDDAARLFEPDRRGEGGSLLVGGDLVRRGRVRPSGRAQTRPGTRFLVVVVVVVVAERQDDDLAAAGGGRATSRCSVGARGLSQFVRPDGTLSPICCPHRNPFSPSEEGGNGDGVMGRGFYNPSKKKSFKTPPESRPRNLPTRAEAGEVARRGKGRRDAPGDAGGIGAAGCQFRSIHTETCQ